MQNFLNINDLFAELPPKIAVAVSGGADSVALVHHLNESFGKSGVEVIALVVDHKLRPESSDEAKLVAQRLRKHGIKAEILSVITKISKNLQENARKARYKLLINFCKRHEIENLFVAHTSNDQAENLMIRIIRGTGVDGLAAMKQLQVKRGVRIIRPMLAVKRAQVEEFLSSRGLEWVDDPSNENEKFDRVKVRKIMSLLRSAFPTVDIDKRFSLTAMNCARARDFLVKQEQRALREYVHLEHAQITVDFALIEIEHQEIVARVFRKIFKYFGSKLVGYHFETLLRHLGKMRNSAQYKFTYQKCVVMLEKRKVYIFPEIGKDTLVKKLIPGKKNTFYNFKFKADDSDLTVRLLGEQLAPALRSELKIKIPHIMMASQVAIFKKDQLIALPGLRKYADLNVKIDIKKL